MFALIKITHQALNSLDSVRGYLPKALGDVEGLTYIDEAGTVQAGLKINLKDNDSLEGLHDVTSKMGCSSIRFVISGDVVMDSRTDECKYAIRGFWTEAKGHIKAIGTTYFINNQRFFINEVN